MSTPSREPTRLAPNDDALAWELAAAARPYLTGADSDRIYIAIGIGETFTAIERLISASARYRIPLSGGLLATLATWLDCYQGQDAEPRLRQLIDELKTHAPQDSLPPQQKRTEDIVAS